MSNPQPQEQSLEIRSLVEQLFTTSATDEQLKLRLVKNIEAYCNKQVIRELKEMKNNLSTSKTEKHDWYTVPSEVIEDRLEELEGQL